MKVYRLNSMAAGSLYIIGTVSGILAFVAIGGAPDDSFMSRLIANPDGSRIAAFFILVMGISLASMTLFLYPLFRKDSEPLALGMVLFRGAFEGTWYILTSLIWVTLGLLANQIASAVPETAVLGSIGEILVLAEKKLGDIGSIVFIIGAVCLYISFLRTRLIPLWLSIWGLAATVPYLGYYLLDFFSKGFSPLILMVIPLAIQEIIMGLWLIIKGFRQEAVAKL